MLAAETIGMKGHASAHLCKCEVQMREPLSVQLAWANFVTQSAPCICRLVVSDGASRGRAAARAARWRRYDLAQAIPSLAWSESIWIRISTVILGCLASCSNVRVELETDRKVRHLHHTNHSKNNKGSCRTRDRLHRCKSHTLLRRRLVNEWAYLRGAATYLWRYNSTHSCLDRSGPVHNRISHCYHSSWEDY